MRISYSFAQNQIVITKSDTLTFLQKKIKKNITISYVIGNNIVHYLLLPKVVYLEKSQGDSLAKKKIYIHIYESEIFFSYIFLKEKSLLS